MAEVKKLLRKGVSVGVSALLVLLLWPVIPMQAQALAEEGTSATEGVEAVEPEAEGAVAPQTDAVPVVASLDDDLAADEGAFQEIRDVLKAKTYRYDTKAELKPEEFTGNTLPVLNLAYTFTVDAVVDANNLTIAFADNNASNIFGLSITPNDVLNATSPSWPVKINITCTTDPTKTVTPIEFEIKQVGKKALELSVDPLPYRLDRAQQETPAREAVQNAVFAAVLKAEDKPASAADCLASFVLNTYPINTTTGKGDDAAITFALAPTLVDKYEVNPSLTKLKISDVASTPVTDIPGFTVGGKPADGTAWVNGAVDSDKVMAVYGDHTLSKALSPSSGYVEELPMNGGEGEYLDGELYAQDSTGVITKVTGIAYRIDRTAPELKTYSVSDPSATPSGFWFFNNKAHVTVTAVDPEGSTPGVPISGLSQDSRIEYVDSHSGKTISKGGLHADDEGNATGTLEFDIDGDQDVKVASFKASLRDVAGNASDPDMANRDLTNIPDDVMQLVTCAGNPQITIAFDNNDARNGSYYNAGRVVTVTVTEPNFKYIQQFDPNQVVATIIKDGHTRIYKPGDFHNIGGERWQITDDCIDDGDYSIQVQLTDLMGKASEHYSSQFTVDKTAPTISVTFDNESATSGNYYNAARTATISVSEHNFSSGLIDVAPTSGAGNGASVTSASSSSWSDNGDTHICTVTFPGQGVYGLTVSGTDLARNALPQYSAPEFTIDTEKPQVSISVNGDADASSRAYKDGCSVSVTIDDTNADPSSTVTITPIGLNSTANPYMASPSASATQITYSSPDPARDPQNDNVYRVEVNAMDMAGNTESKVVDWSVNRFGSTYVLHDDTQNMVNKRYLKTEDTKDVKITEINPSGINEDEVLVSLASGAKNNTLNKDEHYSFVPSADSGWPAYEYTIPRNNFMSDGTYQVMLHSTDAAGNSSMNTMDNKSADRTNTAEVIFSVDNTAPIVTFNGFNESAVSANSHEVGFSIEDNTKLDRAVIRVNGEKVQTLDADALEDPSNLRLTLNESGDNQMVTVEAYDMANNMDPQDSPSIFVNSNPILRLFHNPILVVGVLAAIVAVAAAVIFLLIPFLKKRKLS